MPIFSYLVRFSVVAEGQLKAANLDAMHEKLRGEMNAEEFIHVALKQNLTLEESTGSSLTIVRLSEVDPTGRHVMCIDASSIHALSGGTVRNEIEEYIRNQENINGLVFPSHMSVNLNISTRMTKSIIELLVSYSVLRPMKAWYHKNCAEYNAPPHTIRDEMFPIEAKQLPKPCSVCGGTIQRLNQLWPEPCYQIDRAFRLTYGPETA